MAETLNVRVLFVGQSGSAVRSVRSLESSFAGLHRTAKLAAGALAVGFVGGLGVALDKAGDFERALNVLRATSGATERQMAALRKEARALGADTRLPATSAKDAADAMLELSKGGLSVANTLKATRGVLQLSTAAQIDNAEAATITARALNAFGLAGEEATHVADVLANAANVSTGEITDFALALQQSSAVAHAYGLTLEDTAALLTQLADAGIVGSDAGTLLKRTLQTLEPTSAKNAALMRELGLETVNTADGHLDLTRTVELFSRQLGKLDPVERRRVINQLAGSDAARAWNILLTKGTTALVDHEKAVSRAGTAEEIAAAQTEGFKGALEGFKSAVDTLLIDLGTPLLGAAEQATRALSGIVGEIDKIASAGSLKVAVDVGVEDLDALRQRISRFLFGHPVDVSIAFHHRDVAGGWVPGVVSQIRHEFERVDWDSIGREIAEGIGSGLVFSVETINTLLRSITDWVKGHLNELLERFVDTRVESNTDRISLRIGREADVRRRVGGY